MLLASFPMSTLFLLAWSVFFSNLSTAHTIPKLQTLASSNDTKTLDSSSDECKPYYYAPVDTRLASFPPIWEPAYILDGDSNAEAKFEEIKGSIPTIAPKGTIMGDITAVNYTEDDPDCWWTYTKCTAPKRDGLQSDVVDLPEPRTLGYGFDDGPNCSHNAFYDYLSSKNQKATMFYIGSNVMDWPLEAQRGVQDGHEICVHTWSHRYMTAFSDRDAFAELYYTMQAIKLVTDVTPTCWRPPFGDIDDRIRAIALGLGLRTIVWKYDSNDWRMGSDGTTEDDVGKNYDALLKDVQDGAFDSAGVILLAHELNAFTMAEAIKYHLKLKDAFSAIVPIAVGLNITQPYVEEGIVMPSFSEYTSRVEVDNNDTSSVSNTTSGAPSSTVQLSQTADEANEASEPTATLTLPSSGIGKRRRSSLNAIFYTWGVGISISFLAVI